MTENCEVCSFRNPKATVTALPIKDGKLLMALRNEEPFKGMWDLVGGYMDEGERPLETLKRELREEIGVEPTEAALVDFFPGTASWKGKDFPILSIVYQVTLPEKELILNKENSALRWFSKEKLPKEIAFDSNNDIVTYAKNNGLVR